MQARGVRLAAEHDVVKAGHEPLDRHGRGHARRPAADVRNRHSRAKRSLGAKRMAAAHSKGRSGKRNHPCAGRGAVVPVDGRAVVGCGLGPAGIRERKLPWVIESVANLQHCEGVVLL